MKTGTRTHVNNVSKSHGARRDSVPAMADWIRPVLTGLIIGALTCLAVLMVFSLIMASVDVPQVAATPFAVIAAASGAFIGGLVCARAVGNHGLLYGALCGAILYAVVMLAGFAFLKDVRGVYALAKLLIMSGMGGIGGIIGVNRKTAGKRRR